MFDQNTADNIAELAALGIKQKTQAAASESSDDDGQKKEALQA